MIKFMIIGFTLILSIIGIFALGFKKNKIKEFFSELNNSYFKLANSQGKIMKNLFIIIGFAIILLILSLSITRRPAIIDGKFTTAKLIVYKAFLFCVTTFIMYLFFGTILLIFNKISELIISIKNDCLSKCLFVSFLILILDTFFCITSNNDIKDCKFIVFFGLTISYLLNISMLIKIVSGTLGFLGDKKNTEKHNKNYLLHIVIKGSLLLLILIIINLFLGVVMISYSFNTAYIYSITNNSVTELFELLYYTVISFTTVGYGDIIPNVLASKLMAIIISFTSVMCLIIFVGSTLSIMDKLREKEV